MLYESNFMGLKGPRKMVALLPKLKADGSGAALASRHETMGRMRGVQRHGTLKSAYKAKAFDEVLVLQNKQPTWNADTGAFTLDFKGRVTQASVKNFQLVHSENPEYVVLQFGRVGAEKFTMDYQWPMTALQAFQIVLTSFDWKLACE